jgi:hypothetical protein
MQNHHSLFYPLRFRFRFMQLLLSFFQFGIQRFFVKIVLQVEGFAI